MGRIQSDIGLITGVDIGSTVTKLMALAAKPRDNVLAQITDLKNQNVAVTELTALLASFQYSTDALGKISLFSQRTATSGDSAALGATVTGTPALGSYQFTPLQVVQSQQLASSGYQSDTAAIGPGTLRFRFGNDLTTSPSLDLLRGGEGFARGKIRITDRSGASSEIDLTTALTLQDVLKAINDNSTINVTAVAHGDSIRLIDETGQEASNLKVQEVGSGRTAASLGLAGINAAAGTADGQDVVWLHEGLRLSELNGGLGVRFNTAMHDIEFTLRDGTTGQIDFSPLIPGGSAIEEDRTLGDVIKRINAAAPDKLRASLSPDGDHIVLTDLTSGDDEFRLDAAYGSSALADLGLDAAAQGATISSRRLLGGLATPLLSQLGGGRGLGPLGALTLTDRDGRQATVDLGHAETLDDVLNAINRAGTNITARINSSRLGIELVDSSSGTGRMTVASGDDGLDTAGKLNLAVDDLVRSADSGDLHLAVVGFNTRLDELNGGAGVARGTFTLVDSNGQRTVVNLSNDQIQTVGDLIREINRLASGVEAELNATGDGIVLRDTAGGEGTLQVIEGSKSTAAGLRLLGEVTTVDGRQTIDGSMTYTIELDDDDSLSDLRDKINNLNAGLQATIFSDGSGRPYRLSLTSQRAGLAGRFVFESSGIGLELQETVEARNAVLAVGDASRPATSVLLTSTSNRFANVLPGVSLDVKKASGQVVSITVGSTDTNLVATVKSMVDNYNKFRTRLKSLTSFNTTTSEAAVLAGDATALRLDTDLPRLISGRFLGVNDSVRSLNQIGVSIGQDGSLSFDESKLKSAYAADPEGVQKFLAGETDGLSAKFHKMLEQLAGVDNSLLSNRIKTLQTKIDNNQERVDRMNASLKRQSDALYLQFYRMETAIGKLQGSLTAIQAIQPLSISRSSRSS